VNKENVVALQRAEMRMIRWMCDYYYYYKIYIVPISMSFESEALI